MSSTSSIQKDHHDSLLKEWKFITFPTTKFNDLIFFFLKAGLILCTFFFITLFLFLTFSYHPHSYHHTPFQPSLHLTVSDDSSTIQNNQPTNISHIVFGIGGSFRSWQNRRNYTELWWQPNVTRGFMWLEEDPPANEIWPETLPLYKVSGDTSRFKYTCDYGSRSAIRLARIVKETFEQGLENVRWFVMGDDDTVFFTENLVTVLAKYDHNEMYYIGGNSESVEQDVIHSYDMAYGGGGFAVSYPLVAALVKILDGCIDRYASFYGSDEKVHGCINEIGIPVTRELGFHQIDIRGYLYGLLAAHPVAPLVSMHHLDYVDPMFPNTTRFESLHKLVSAYKTDPGRTLQQSICYDHNRNWSISVSWGYSVQLYHSIETPDELATPFRTFQTWRSWSNEPFTFKTRPVNNDPCQRPLWFFLDRVENVGKGRTRTAYKRYDSVLLKNFNCSVPTSGVEYINVTASYFMPEMWRKAPRRQCCDIKQGADEKSNVIQVEIRSCNNLESVTPL